MGNRLRASIGPILPKAVRNPGGSLQDQIDAIFRLLRAEVPIGDDFQVLDETGKPIAWFGTKYVNNVLRRGVWSREQYIGGDSVADAKIVADVNGNVSITDATFTLTGNDAITTIDNTSMGGYPAGLKIESTTDDYESYITTRTLRFNNGANSVIFLNTYGDYGAISLYDASGQPVFEASQGYVATKVAYLVDGDEVVRTRKADVSSASTCAVADAGDTYTTGVRDLINDLKSKLNTHVGLFNDLLGRLRASSGHGLLEG